MLHSNTPRHKTWYGYLWTSYLGIPGHKPFPGHIWILKYRYHTPQHKYWCHYRRKGVGHWDRFPHILELFDQRSIHQCKIPSMYCSGYSGKGTHRNQKHKIEFSYPGVEIHFSCLCSLWSTYECKGLQSSPLGSFQRRSWCQCLRISHGKQQRRFLFNYLHSGRQDSPQELHNIQYHSFHTFHQDSVWHNSLLTSIDCLSSWLRISPPHHLQKGRRLHRLQQSHMWDSWGRLHGRSRLGLKKSHEDISKHSSLS